mgnify:FL=1
MKRAKKKTALVITPEMAAMAASPEELAATIDRAAAAARMAAPGYEVIVMVITPLNAFRVNWGAMAVDRASWLVYRTLIAIEKLL